MVEPPASAAQVQAVERVLGRALPESFRDVLLGFLPRVDSLELRAQEQAVSDASIGIS